MSAVLDTAMEQLRHGRDPRTIVESIAPRERAAIRESLSLVLAHAVIDGDLELLARRLARIVILLHYGIEAERAAQIVGTKRLLGMRAHTPKEA